MQTTSRITTAIVLSLSLGFPMAASAQTPAVDTGQVAAECAKSAALCEAAVVAAIAALKALGLTPTQLNAQLGVLASAALSGAESLPPAEKLALAGTLTAISDSSSDSAQKSALANLAGAFASGAPVDLQAFAAAISAS